MQLAREATNGWACHARTRAEHDEIARLHRELNRLSEVMSQGLSRAKSLIASDALRERFEAFWVIYPRKIGKAAAWKVWQQQKPDDVLTARILAVVMDQSRSVQWLSEGGRFIPHARTWLSQGRWEDGPIEPIPQLSAKTARTLTSGAQFVAGEK